MLAQPGQISLAKKFPIQFGKTRFHALYSGRKMFLFGFGVSDFDCITFGGKCFLFGLIVLNLGAFTLAERVSNWFGKIKFRIRYSGGKSFQTDFGNSNFA